MDQIRKLSISKLLIFSSCSIAVLFALYENLIAPVYPHLYQPDPFSTFETILGIVISIAFIAGLYLGSRGINRPLSIKTFFGLLFGFPCWIPFVVYFLVWLIAGIFFY